MKLPKNCTSLDFLEELATKSKELQSFRKLCASCTSEAYFFEALTYLLALVAHIQNRTAWDDYDSKRSHKPIDLNSLLSDDDNFSLDDFDNADMIDVIDVANDKVDILLFFEQ